MKKLNLLALVGWLTLVGSANAQETPTQTRGDRLCQQLEMGITLEAVQALTDSASLELTEFPGSEGNILFWENPETTELLVVSFLDGILTDFSCSMTVPRTERTQTRPPSTCDGVETGMRLREVETQMEDAEVETSPRRLTASDLLWEGVSPETSEFVRIIITDGVVASVSCSPIPDNELNGDEGRF